MVLFKHYKKKLKKRKLKTPGLESCPQKKGICQLLFDRTPRKPNSAKRKSVWVVLSNKKRIGCYINGIGHNLQKFSDVLVRGRGPKDLPGIKYRLVRNVYDLKCVAARYNARSKYGCKKIR